ncbi:MAG: universal stress protein [Betaproteobacteria bacterium]|jgi:nucleotide-binding universal stress UspA family protein|nr:universal stress protein [Betaproteobacteria bacterium]
MKILVAVDGSEYTKRMLAYLAAHEEWLGASQVFTVLHVAPPIPPRAAGAVDRQTLQAYYDDQSAKVLKPIRAFFAMRPELHVSFMTRVGPAAEQIVKEAHQKHQDLVMMGSHGHGALANLVTGSVATKVLALSKVPVLLVR